MRSKWTGLALILLSAAKIQLKASNDIQLSDKEAINIIKYLINENIENYKELENLEAVDILNEHETRLLESLINNARDNSTTGWTVSK